jgi:hypothetical protein
MRLPLPDVIGTAAASVGVQDAIPSYGIAQTNPVGFTSL